VIRVALETSLSGEGLERNQQDPRSPEASSLPNAFECLLEEEPFSSQLALLKRQNLNAALFKAVQLLIIGYLGGRLYEEKDMMQSEQEVWIEEQFEKQAPRLLEALHDYLPPDLHAEDLFHQDFGGASKAAAEKLSGKSMLRKYKELRALHNDVFASILRRYSTADSQLL